MEAFATYLLKSVSWLTGFALVYLLFLRNERFFVLKRVYLIAGMVFSIVFPFVSVHYQVELPATALSNVDLTPSVAPMNTTVQQLPVTLFDYRAILLLLYISGTLFLVYKMVRHVMVLCNVISKVKINNRGPAKMVRASGFPSSFSFFNYIFINSSLGEAEVEEIMNHEMVHVRQKHWFDLLLVEILRLMQWVNPFAWIYTGFIRQNHEYLADEVAIRQTSNPANYRAALLNQLFNSPVISLSNSLNYSLNKKRFDMMKKINTSPYRKLKILLVFPVIAFIFYAFATPEYHYNTPSENAATAGQIAVAANQTVKGVVLKEDGTPFAGVPIVVTGTTMGAATDEKGNFTIGNVPEDAFLVFSYVGYKTQVVKAQFTGAMTIKLLKDPEYQSPVQTRSTSSRVSQPEPLVVIDDVITEKKMRDIPSDDIGTITVLRDKAATDKYGEKGKNGVIEVITKKRAAELGIKVPFRRKNPEDFPTFQGERFTAFRNWVLSRVTYPAEAKTRNLEGWVHVNFIVEADGAVSNVRFTGSADPLLGDAVVQVVKTSPKWEPAKNPEAKDPYESSVTVRFRLPDQVLKEEAFVVVEQMPVYPGGDAELLKFIAENTQYPEAAKAENIQGRVIVRFIINTEGNTEDISVLKSVHPLLDAEAARVVGMLKGFVPGYQGGNPVSVYYMVPITFTLKSTSTEIKDPQPASSAREPFVVVEEMPVYPGGDKVLLQHVAERVQYPEAAKAEGIQGRVIVRFAVTKEGNVDNLAVLKGVHPLLDAEAVRVINTLTGWKPGYQGGNPVDVWYMAPVNFALASKIPETKQEQPASTHGETTAEDTKSSKEIIVIGYKDGASPAGPLRIVNASDRSPANPLIIIDGVISDMKNLEAIDPNNIASISVLKDQSATDVYGEKGKNGVVIVKLK